MGPVTIIWCDRFGAITRRIKVIRGDSGIASGNRVFWVPARVPILVWEDERIGRLSGDVQIVDIVTYLRSSSSSCASSFGAASANTLNSAAIEAILGSAGGFKIRSWLPRLSIRTLDLSDPRELPSPIITNPISPHPAMWCYLARVTHAVWTSCIMIENYFLVIYIDFLSMGVQVFSIASSSLHNIRLSMQTDQPRTELRVALECRASDLE